MKTKNNNIVTGDSVKVLSGPYIGLVALVHGIEHNPISLSDIIIIKHWANSSELRFPSVNLTKIDDPIMRSRYVKYVWDCADFPKLYIVIDYIVSFFPVNVVRGGEKRASFFTSYPRGDSYYMRSAKLFDDVISTEFVHKTDIEPFSLTN